ncbi:mitochondrial genome maintenance MGM101 [Punctularia strigosozonata HHB-11173 SS5]|uniref:mitochondrial genome maintenance MGM101 n=1 Tax=Punctularia strigosozonata (strain HHB-11173) TaxID=741275 RepID=UPI00044171C4|nr:mitochondrial genome maintenance MGM101 [Punctularia strigosozonata HHB-11173 SS5]EIN10932.1 mitochondrial genome maintenance MGM101 [Punctularia strigosozonata HHB-11173 SS5]
MAAQSFLRRVSTAGASRRVTSLASIRTTPSSRPAYASFLHQRAASTQANFEDVLAEAGTAAPRHPVPTTQTTPVQTASNPSASPFPMDEPPTSLEGETDWSKSYQGLSQEAFSKEVADVLLAPIDPLDVECKPDGLIYLPEIKYRRILNKAFGPGGWGLAPRSPTNVSQKIVSREYALVCLGRLVAVARGEQEYFDPNGIPTATEAAKSNALMRCCKDLGIASELWDPRFIREFKAKHCVEVFAEHVPTKKKKKLWRRRDQPKFDYPWKE